MHPRPNVVAGFSDPPQKPAGPTSAFIGGVLQCSANKALIRDASSFGPFLQGAHHARRNAHIQLGVFFLEFKPHPLELREIQIGQVLLRNFSVVLSVFSLGTFLFCFFIFVNLVHSFTFSVLVFHPGRAFWTTVPHPFQPDPSE